MNRMTPISDQLARISPSEMLTEPGETARWAKALAIVIALHAIPLTVAAWWLGPVAVAPPPETAIFIDMAPPASPPIPPTERPPGPEQTKVELPKPRIAREEVRAPSLSNPAVALPAPEPKVEAKASVQDTQAPPARPSPPAPALSSGVVTWQGLVLGALNRAKRYPSAAQLRRQQGAPWIRVVVNREGRVLSSRLERSSGFKILDGEAVNLPRRAEPLPKPPADISGETIELVVPVEFFMRGG